MSFGQLTAGNYRKLGMDIYIGRMKYTRKFNGKNRNIVVKRDFFQIQGKGCTCMPSRMKMKMKSIMIFMIGDMILSIAE